MYEWQKMTLRQRAEVLDLRRQSQSPWHSPPHYSEDGVRFYHLTGACYEHAPIIGASPERMTQFEIDVRKTLGSSSNQVYAWCILPNHWHALIQTEMLKETIAQIGRLHGRTSFKWNNEDEARGRKCWHGCADRRIRSDAHRFAVQNYIHHNPVKHGYAERREDWAFSSATDYLERMGRDAVVAQWKKYPVLEMGVGWDD